MERQALLWTDGRYWLQAVEQLAGTGIELMRSGKIGVPKPEEFIASALSSKDRRDGTKLSQGKTVGVHGETYMAAEYDKLTAALEPRGITVRTTEDLFKKIWTEGRPKMPSKKIFSIRDSGDGTKLSRKQPRGTRGAGQFVPSPLSPPPLSRPPSRLTAVRTELEKRGADAILITDLASVAWLFEFRGSDIEYTPVAYARAIVTRSEAILFIDPAKVPTEILSSLKLDDVSVRNFGDAETYLSGLACGTRVVYDPDSVSIALRDSLPSDAIRVETPDPTLLLKAVKTDEEIANLRRCHERDGRAMVRFLIWLEERACGACPPQKPISELDAARKLTELRAEDPLSLGDSFVPICAHGANGAIVHYSPRGDSAATLDSAGFFVVDSGGQYRDGTTDITRTVPLGNVDDWSADCEGSDDGGDAAADTRKAGDAARRDYTLVLKAHIALASAEFRYGVAGAHLDAISRRVLWKEGLDYAHGTGHGVGYALGVHETPPTLTSSPNAGVGAMTPIEPNMVFSNEPGLYRAGKYGIRIENLVTPYVSRENEFGKFLKLETLSLCPIDLTPLLPHMLTQAEKEWLNAYHRNVYERLAPGLTEQERLWLAGRTQEI
jgi:Xaa-Pro aminopeptidase